MNMNVKIAIFLGLLCLIQSMKANPVAEKTTSAQSTGDEITNDDDNENDFDGVATSDQDEELRTRFNKYLLEKINNNNINNVDNDPAAALELKAFLSQMKNYLRNSMSLKKLLTIDPKYFEETESRRQKKPSYKNERRHIYLG